MVLKGFFFSRGGFRRISNAREHCRIHLQILPVMPTGKKVAKKAATKAVKKVAKKTAAKKTAAKKSAAEKTAAKKATPRSKPVTRIIARVDVRFGNTLFVRGEGGGLSWTEGSPMENISADEWKWETAEADSGIVFKFLVNDEIWSNGDDQTVAAGSTSISTPSFY